MGGISIMAKNIELIHAIIKINPTAVVCVNGDDLYENIEWQNDTPVIPKAELEAKQAELQADYDAKQYQRDRNPDEWEKVNATNFYPSIGDQLDMLFHDKKDGTTTWEDAIQAVKDAHPKP
jgi:hypothetical protein